MGYILQDKFGRLINYARISITDRCNLRCFYCMPASGIKLISRSEVLSYSEIIRMSKIFGSLGINKIRITGGEPLVRKEANKLICDLLKSGNNTDIAVTTNGTNLNKYIDSFSKAGLKKINISLDTLNADQYHKITRSNMFSPVQIVGYLKEALKSGIDDIKINSVLSGINDNKDIYDLIKLSLDLKISIKFIEMMQVENLFNKINSTTEYSNLEDHENPVKNVISGGRSSFSEKILSILGGFGKVIKDKGTKGFGPAVYFKVNNSKECIGIVSGDMHPCRNCNRIRVTSDGKLKNCLYWPSVLDLKKMLRNNYSDTEIGNEIANCIVKKPYNKFFGADGENNSKIAAIPDFMNKIGG
jgi:GTP 3',8-cyclase